MKQFVLPLFILPLFLLSFSQGNAQISTSKKGNIPEVTDMFTPLCLNDVKVNGEIGRRIDITLQNNIQCLDIDNDFILPFQKKESSGGFVGIGMFIDAVAKFAAYTRQDEIIAKKKHLVSKLIETQLNDGYIGMCKTESRMWELWDIHEMAYIIFGLATDYELFNEKESLEAAIKTADYILRHWASMPDGWEQRTRVNLFEATTGIDRAMLALYRHTGEQRFLDFSVNVKGLGDWDLDIVLGRWPGLDGHIYGYMGMCLAQLEMYRLFPQKKLLKQSRKAIDFLTKGNGMVITGEAGQWEMWNNDQQGDDALGETCATAYQIRTYENLFRLTGEAKYGDLMERTIYNALFAAQSPDGRKIRYYTPIKGPREYFDKDTYCCPNNYRRIISELPAMIYYRDNANGICINQYSASSAEIKLSDGVIVNLEQETDYPRSGKVKIIVSPSQPTYFPLQLRIPAWSAKMKMSVNGKAADMEIDKAGFATIERKWSKNDTLSLEIPMDWRFVKGRQRQAGRVAVMRGPVLFCLNISNNQGQGLEQMTDNEIGRIILDPSSVKLLSRNEVGLQQKGLICKIGAWKKGWGMCDEEHDMELLLTEFPDPEGTSVYFNIAGKENQVEDELFQIKQ